MFELLIIWLMCLLMGGIFSLYLLLKTIMDRIWDLDRKITQVAYLVGDIKKALKIDE